MVLPIKTNPTGSAAMKYYVTADVHGFYTPFAAALREAGFFEDAGPRKLVICGDLFDRGSEALRLQEFILELMERDEVILVRGNHEDLMLQLLGAWHRHSYNEWHHQTNGTVDTALLLTGCTREQLDVHPESVGRRLLYTPFVQRIIPAMTDYFETPSHIFVHGWIPCRKKDSDGASREYLRGWRNAAADAWADARWVNGMRAAADGVTEPFKTVVCGHWHCSYGHAVCENRGSEFGPAADFTPYRSEGILALDAATARSGIVNCAVIED